MKKLLHGVASDVSGEWIGGMCRWVVVVKPAKPLLSPVVCAVHPCLSCLVTGPSLFDLFGVATSMHADIINRRNIDLHQPAYDRSRR